MSSERFRKKPVGNENNHTANSNHNSHQSETSPLFEEADDTDKHMTIERRRTYQEPESLSQNAGTFTEGELQEFFLNSSTVLQELLTLNLEPNEYKVLELRFTHCDKKTQSIRIIANMMGLSWAETQELLGRAMKKFEELLDKNRSSLCLPTHRYQSITKPHKPRSPRTLEAPADTLVDQKKFEINKAKLKLILYNLGMGDTSLHPEKMSELTSQLNSLPETNRQILILTFGLINNKSTSIEEIATLVRKSTKTIYRTLSQSLELLAIRLGEDFFKDV